MNSFIRTFVIFHYVQSSNEAIQKQENKYEVNEDIMQMVSCKGRFGDVTSTIVSTSKVAETSPAAVAKSIKDKFDCQKK